MCITLQLGNNSPLVLRFETGSERRPGIIPYAANRLRLWEATCLCSNPPPLVLSFLVTFGDCPTVLPSLPIPLAFHLWWLLPAGWSAAGWWPAGLSSCRARKA